MATTVHLPRDLLARVDRRAKSLGISRNRFITQALEATLTQRQTWPPEFVAMLSQPVDPEIAEEFERSMAEVKAQRISRKRRPDL